MSSFTLSLVVCCCLLSFVSQTGNAQEAQLPPVIRDIMEDYAREEEGDMDYAQLVDELLYRMDEPLNLNAARREDFRYFIFLNNLQVEDILRIRRRLGGFNNLFQLQLVPSLTNPEIQTLGHFAVTEPVEEPVSGKLRRSLRHGRHDLFLRYERTLEEQQGYKPATEEMLKASPNSRYLGNPDKYYLRYSYRSQNIRWGINAEKDPGEEFFSGYQKQGFDFYSAYLMLEGLSWADALVLGDFTMQAGQGLALWSGMSFGQGAQAVSVKKNAVGLRPSTSMNEYGFLRGAALTKRLGRITTTVFYSLAPRDANIGEQDSAGNILYVRSIQKTGLHNTVSLAENKHAITEQLAGGNITARFNRLKVGITATHYSLSAPLIPNKQLYAKYRFSGDQRAVGSVDYEYNRRNVIIFGETGYSDNGGWGTLNGITFKPAGGVYMSILHRYYSMDFQNVKGGALGSNSANQNEKGLYAGVQAQLGAKVTLNAYADHYQYPWLNFRVDAPSRGRQYRIQVDYDAGRRWSAYIRGFNQITAQNLSSAQVKINQPVSRNRKGGRIHFSWKASSWLKMNSQAQWSRVTLSDGQPDKGWLIYQDVLVRPHGHPLNLSFRYAVFNTDSYDARLFAYEHDVLYAFSIPAYFYQGIRAYMVVRYKITRNLQVWIRVARTRYTHRDHAGSGLNRIDMPHKTDVKAQIRMRF